MSYLVVWTDRASHDLERHYFFLAEKDEDAGLKAVEAIEKGTLILEQFPNAGRPADDLDPEQRELLVPFGTSGYVLVYEVDADHSRILAVRHQKEVGY